MAGLPTGTVTFLFTDIEGSTVHWERDRVAMQQMIGRHNVLLQQAIDANHGVIFKTVGDAFCAAFDDPIAALASALSAQRALTTEQWGQTAPLQVRMALHTGLATPGDSDYIAPCLHRLSRLLSAGYGGQTLLSQITQQLVREHLPPNVSLRDLGEHRLRDLLHSERIFQVVDPDLPSEFPPLKTLERYRTNLPIQPTPFVGRDYDTSTVQEMTRREVVRLVTLTGPGGIGKTRLAVQVAADLLPEFGDGAFLVELDALADPGLVIDTIAQVLGVHESGGQSSLENLKLHMREKHLLLVLDNFEHVTTAAPDVGDLLIACPGVKVLVTSRQPLGLPAESEYPVPSLSLPDLSHLPTVERLAQGEAVALFVDRTRAVKPTFVLTSENAAAVAELCVRLDGLPLAIELAAATMRFLSPCATLDRLHNRLPLPDPLRTGVPNRQKTLKNTIDWSYNLLSPDDRALFRLLTVFAGDFSLEAAEAVCASVGSPPGNVLTGIAALVNQSLLRQVDRANGEPRFALLQTIREYGLEQLQETAEAGMTHRAHAEYFLAIAERADRELFGSAQMEWLDRLEAERDNLRAALEWALRQPDAKTALRLASILRPFWQIRGYLREGYDWIERALAKGEEAEPAMRAAGLYGLGRLAFDLEDYARAPEWFEASLTLRRQLNDQREIAESLTDLGFFVAAQGDSARARSLHEEARAIWSQLGDERGVADSLYGLGNLAQDDGDFGGARALYREALAKSHEAENTIFVANLHLTLGSTARLEGDGEAAARSVEQSLVLFRRVGNKIGIGNALLEMGHASRLLGNEQQAEQSYVNALILFQELESKPGMVEGLEALAGIAAHHGRVAHAARLLGSATTWREILDQPFVPAVDRIAQERLASELRHLNAVAFAAGRSMTLEQATTEGLTNVSYPENAIDGIRRMNG